jgi:hypothetical protein
MSVTIEIHKVTPALLILTTEFVSCHAPGASSLEMAAGILENLWTLAKHCNRLLILR